MDCTLITAASKKKSRCILRGIFRSGFPPSWRVQSLSVVLGGLYASMSSRIRKVFRCLRFEVAETTIARVLLLCKKNDCSNNLLTITCQQAAPTDETDEASPAAGYGGTGYRFRKVVNCQTPGSIKVGHQIPHSSSSSLDGLPTTEYVELVSISTKARNTPKR